MVSCATYGSQSKSLQSLWRVLRLPATHLACSHSKPSLDMINAEACCSGFTTSNSSVCLRPPNISPPLPTKRNCCLLFDSKKPITKPPPPPSDKAVRPAGPRHVTVEVPECRAAPGQEESFEVTRVLPVDATPGEIFAGAMTTRRWLSEGA